MHKIVHLFFAARVRKQVAALTGISLSRFRFSYGNIYPDLTFSMCVTPHKLPESIGLLRSYVDELYERPMHIFEFSKKLGIAMHYVCDYFCYAHSEKFTGSLLKHMIYEFSMIRTILSLPVEPAESAKTGGSGTECTTAAALSAFVQEQVAAHTEQEQSSLQDVTSALCASEAFCFDAIRRWCVLSFEPFEEFDWEEAESAIAV